MTRNNPNDARRRGSALLIVLGFLAFMIVSAVTYSIYMRAERMPSSALRRTVATRQLVHAALARAISQVDDAVRDDPFPGLTCGTKYMSQGNDSGEMDHWVGRVFLPPSATATGEQLYHAPIAKTVSTLTLEGLGYIPPPLVNDARFLSRSSWAGQWSTLPFDSGRSAYCAINVSDMLDVTRLYANKPRSATEGGRISLAYLFDTNFDPEKESGSCDGFGSEPEDFDKLVHDQREGGSGSNTIGKDAPFVSMLDYSLGIQKGIAGVMESLFYKWISGAAGIEQPFYEEEGDRARWARRQPFVTESCTTNQTYLVDIGTVDGQPFKDSAMKSEPSSVMQVASAATTFFTQLQTAPTQLKFTNGSDAGILFASLLYDYLDHDSSPLSLALPCVERAPMLAGLAPEDFKIRPTKAESSGSEKSGETTTTRWTLGLLNWFSGSRFRVVIAFPYKHNQTDRSMGQYSVQLLARLAVVPSSCTSLRSKDLHEALRPKNKSDWESSEEAGTLKGTKGVFCVSFKVKQNLEEPANIVNDDQAGKSIELQFEAPSGLSASMDFLERKQTEGKDGQASTTTYTAHLVPLGTDGKPVVTPETEITSDEYASKLVGESYTPMLFIWARIVDSEGQTVDLVPAVLEDDQDLNGINSQISQLSTHCGSRSLGPLMRFLPENTSFNWQNLTEGGGSVTGEDKNWAQKAFATVDPRYNWAPEDWYACEQSVVTDFSTWLDSVNKYLSTHANSDKDLDSDIFTFTSDQGFLQSLGEFAFLPRVTNEAGTLALAQEATDGFDGVLRTEMDKIANKNCVWRSYRVDREFYEAMAARGIGRSTQYECLINPYSADTSVLMAAFANPPSDYWSAGVCATTENERKGRELKSKFGMTDGPKVEDAKTALKYAFCSKNNDAKLTYTELIKLAKAFKSKMRGNVDNAASDKGYDENLAECGKVEAWQAIFDDYGHGDSDREGYQLQWWARANDDNSFNTLFGETLEQPLYGVDRKFLYSYWRDCFANQQQLFLFFVRAESSALGGSGEGTPGQKGGRAVAMVWRNPNPTKDGDRDGAADDKQQGYLEDRRPHPTRVLFYHQFD